MKILKRVGLLLVAGASLALAGNYIYVDSNGHGVLIRDNGNGTYTGYNGSYIDGQFISSTATPGMGNISPSDAAGWANSMSNQGWIPES